MEHKGYPEIIQKAKSTVYFPPWPKAQYEPLKTGDFCKNSPVFKGDNYRGKMPAKLSVVGGIQDVDQLLAVLVLRGVLFPKS